MEREIKASDLSGAVPPATDLARGLLARLERESTELRAAAVLDAQGTQLAATDDADWSSAATALWVAADAGPGGPATQVHVGGEAGEVLAVRGDRHSIVATAQRFALASLMFCDLRAVLRGLERDEA